MSDTTLIVGANCFETIAPNTPYVYCLNKELNEANSDISEIKLINPENHIIDKIIISIGGEPILIYDNSEINNIKLPEGGLLISKALYFNFHITVYFNEEYIRSKYEYGLKDEYTTIVEEGNELLQFRDADTDEIREGYLHTTRKEKTGRQVETLLSYPTLEMPSFECLVFPRKIDNSILVTPYWEKIMINPSKYSAEHLAKLIEKHHLQTDDGESVIEKYNKGDTFVAKIKNQIRYVENMAGKMYIF
jgi:hypothetical protein